jgi:putative hemolysin
MESIWIELTLIVVAILLNGFFAGAETALVSSRISRLVQMREAVVGGASAALRLKERPEAFLATIQIAITLVGTLASAIGGAAAVEALTPRLAALGLGRWAEPVALGVVILTITYVSLVLGELVPKAIALRDPERLASLVSRPILALGRVSSGLVRLLTASTDAVLRATGLGKDTESPLVSEEEVRYLLREGRAKGIFEKTEEELVHNVFEFTDTTVREIMVPHPNIMGIELTTSFSEVVRQAAAIGHSRIPVYHSTIENLTGLLIVKDLLRAVADRRTPALREMLHPLFFVPEASKISAVLRQFQRQRHNLAIVVDEYGAAVGLVTVKDLIEEVIGEIPDEDEPEASVLITRLADGAAIVDGLTPIRDLREVLGVPVADSPQYTTAAGFVITSLEAIPAPGASVTNGGYRWSVLETRGPRITKIKIERA